MDLFAYHAYQAFRQYLQKNVLNKFVDEDADLVFAILDISALCILLMYSWTFGEFDALSMILVENFPQGIKKFSAATKFIFDFICGAGA